MPYHILREGVCDSTLLRDMGSGACFLYGGFPHQNEQEKSKQECQQTILSALFSQKSLLKMSHCHQLPTSNLREILIKDGERH